MLLKTIREASNLPGQVIFTLTPGFAIPATNFGGYVGYAGFYSDIDSQHFVEAGLTRIVGNDIQLDINAGIETGTGNLFVGAGFAARL